MQEEAHRHTECRNRSADHHIRQSEKMSRRTG